MSDIELVIKIPYETYNRILERNRIHTFDNEVVCDAIKDSTPLPKGHGRLIDVNELKKIIKENDGFIMSGFSVRLCDIDNTPTIIEADKDESEVQE